MSQRVKRMRILIIGENGERIPYEKCTAHVDKEKLRFKTEAERDAHRREIDRRKVANYVETVTNPHERKIDAILAAKRNRKSIYATLPRRNGKHFRSMMLRDQDFSKIVFTETPDPS